MTRDRDIERVLEHWLADGVNEMPDRVYQSIFDRVDRQPQALAPRLLRRLPEMNSSLRWITAAAAVLLIAVVGWNLLPGRSTGPGGVAETPTLAPSASGSATSIAPWRAPDTQCGEGGCGGPLAAGTHTSKALQPTVTYTLTTGWVNLLDGAGDYLLYPDTPANRALATGGNHPPSIMIQSGPLEIVPGARVVGPASDEAVCEGDRPGASPGPMPEFVEANAAQYVDWLASQDGVASTEPIPVTVSGLTGQQVDLAPEAGLMTCLPGTPFGAVTAGTDRYRYFALDNPDGDSLRITLWAPADFDGFVGDAMPVVESFVFDLGPAASPS